jgi:hypothetical protein
MKKIVLAIAVAAIACSPALAAKKHHRKHVAAAQPASGSFADLNDNGFRLVRDSMPIYYPSILKMVLYPVGGSQR